MGSSGLQCSSVGSSGLQWAAVRFSGLQWDSEGSSGIQWVLVLVGFSGFQWSSAGPTKLAYFAIIALILNLLAVGRLATAINVHLYHETDHFYFSSQPDPFDQPTGWRKNADVLWLS